MKKHARIAILVALTCAAPLLAHAETLTLVCSPIGREPEPYLLTIDMDAKTVSHAASAFPGRNMNYQNVPAQISDSTISWDEAIADEHRTGSSRPATVSRITGAYQGKLCGPGNGPTGCTEPWFRQCHKAEKQF